MIGTICLVPFIMALITQLYGDVIVGTTMILRQSESSEAAKRTGLSMAS